MATQLPNDPTVNGLKPAADLGIMPIKTKVARISLGQQIAKNRLPYMLIAPAVFLMILVHFTPSVVAIYMSLLKFNNRTLSLFLGAPFVGLKNYTDILTDRSNPLTAGLVTAARNTLGYAIVVNIGIILIGLGAALLINREFRGRGIVRTLLLTPWIVPTYIVGMVWGRMWSQDSGIINHTLLWLHLVSGDGPSWLIGHNVFWAICIPTIWRGFPFTMILLLSGLQAIPSDIYEAANIDGASIWQRFFYITLPLLTPVTSVIILWGVIGSVYAFNIVIMMFGNGAAYPGEWGDLMQPAIQRQSFGSGLYGLGSAASTMLLIVMMLFVLGWYRIFRNSLTNSN